MTNPYLNINSFDNIPITTKTLVICDIDDTFMCFDAIDRNWWDRQKMVCNMYEYNYNNQIENIMDKWIAHIRINEPLFTDKTGFYNMMNKIDKTGSKLIFITARPNKLRYTTFMQLHMMDIDTEKHPVYIVGETPKGEFIKKNIELQQYKKVVFIDDYIKNINNVLEVFGNGVSCFKFNR
jgi:acid phosphatase class B